MIYALVNGSGLVTNVIEWDGDTPYTPAPGLTAVQVPAGQGVGPGWTYTGGQFHAPPTPPPTPAQILQAALGAGCALQSRSTPYLDGTYAINGSAWTDMVNEAQYISAFGSFSDASAPPFEWPMPNGSAIAFQTTAQFMAVAQALGQYVTALKKWGGVGLQPAQPVVIA